LPILASALSVYEEASIIHIVKYKNPLSLPIIAQPVVYKLEYISFWIVPPKDLDRVCNISKALLKSSRVACVEPENPRFRRLVLGLVRVFDGELRLASQQLAIVSAKAFAPTRRRPGQRARSENLRQRISGGFDQVLSLG
jgi:hypothetical protein